MSTLKEKSQIVVKEPWIADSRERAFALCSPPFYYSSKHKVTRYTRMCEKRPKAHWPIHWLLPSIELVRTTINSMLPSCKYVPINLADAQRKELQPYFWVEWPSHFVSHFQLGLTIFRPEVLNFTSQETHSEAHSYYAELNLERSTLPYYPYSLSFSSVSPTSDSHLCQAGWKLELIDGNGRSVFA